MNDTMNNQTHEHSQHHQDHKKQYIDPLCGMSASSVSVIGNALRLRRVNIGA